MKYMIFILLLSSAALADEHTTSVVINEAFNESAVANHIDVRLLRALCYTESGLHPGARVIADGKGVNQAIGICQVQLATARHYGFIKGTKELFNVHINTYYAGKALAHWLRVSKGNVQKAVSYYNVGHKIHGILAPKVIKVALAMMENR